MRLYIKQKVFSWNDKFQVRDQNGQDRYFVEGEFFSLGKRLHILDASGNEVACIRQRVFSFMQRYDIEIGGVAIAQLVQEFTFFKPRYRLEGTAWYLDGDFWAHDYTLNNGSSTLMQMSKEWFTWGDSYVLDIADPANEVMCLAIALAVDCALDSQRSNN